MTPCTWKDCCNLGTRVHRYANGDLKANLCVRHGISLERAEGSFNYRVLAEARHLARYKLTTSLWDQVKQWAANFLGGMR